MIDDLAKRHGTDAQTVVLSCTVMRAAEATAALEDTLQTPVVTSNQALLYVARKRLKLVDEANPVSGALGCALPAPGVQRSSK